MVGWEEAMLVLSASSVVMSKRQPSQLREWDPFQVLTMLRVVVVMVVVMMMLMVVVALVVVVVMVLVMVVMVVVCERG